MSVIGDSRRSDGAGPGILPMQHHGFEEDGWTVAGRCGVVGVRIKGRLDGTGEFGQWVFEDDSVGDLTNSFLWNRQGEERPVGGWSFLWSATVAQNGRSGGSVGRGGVPTPAPIGSGRTPADAPPTSGEQAENQGPKQGKLDLPGRLIWTEAGSIRLVGPNAVSYFTMNFGGGLAPVGFGPTVPVGKGGWGQVNNASGGIAGVNPKAPGVIVGQPLAPGSPGLVGGAFGIGVPPLIFNPYGGSIGKVPNVFGIGLEPLTPIFVIRRPNPGGNKPVNDQVAAWYGEFDEQPILDMLPLRDAEWLPDGRFKRVIPNLPADWPAFPFGMHGIACAAANEEKQVDYWHPTDPRLIAAHRGPADFGSIVADVSGKYVDPNLQARLHTLTMVVRTPTGGRGILAKNKTQQLNWLSWMIGPTGRYDGHGGLVTDFPPHAGTASRGQLVHGWASCREGGPFSVGLHNDKHRLGTDGDGNPINALHFSTMALWIRHGTGDKVDEDGPILFEWNGYPEDAGELEEPLQCHLDFDMRSGYWRIWTTTIFPTVPPPTKTPETPPDTPGTPTERPRPGTPTPSPGDPGHGPPREGGQGEGTDRGPGEGTKPGPGTYKPRGAPSGTSKGIQGTQNTVNPNRDDPRHYNASYREVAFPSVAFRAPLLRNREPDLRHAEGSSRSQRRAQDNTNPIVLRADAYSAQGDGAQRFRYSQKPRTGSYRGGTASGGIAFTVPEVKVGDKSLDGKSEAYITAGPGVGYGAGKPHLPTGGVSDGHSWRDEDGVLVFYHHESDGSKEEFIRMDGTVVEMNDYSELLFVDAVATQALAAGVPEVIDNYTKVGPERGLVGNATTGIITTRRMAPYSIRMNFTLAFSTGALVEGRVRVNGVEADVAWVFTVRNANDYAVVSAEGIVVVDEGDDISLWVESDRAGTLTIYQGQFVVSQFS